MIHVERAALELHYAAHTGIVRLGASDNTMIAARGVSTSTFTALHTGTGLQTSLTCRYSSANGVLVYHVDGF